MKHRAYHRRLLMGAAGALTLIVLVGLYLYPFDANRGHRSPPAGTNQIVIGTFSKALGNTPFHVAKVRKMFGENSNLKNTTFTFVEFNDRPSIVQSFESGNLDILFSAEIPAMLNYAQGVQAPIIEISGVAQQEVIVPTESQAKSIKDLIGTRLAVLPGTSSHYALISVLNKAGMSLSQLDIVYLSPPEARVEFEAGRLPAWAVWAPWVEQEEVLGLGRPLSDSKASISSVMSVSPLLMKDDPEVAFAIRDVINDAKVWMLSHPEDAQRIAATDLNLSLDVVKQAWPKFSWTKTIGPDDVADFESKANFLAEQKLTRNEVVVDVQKLLKLGIENAAKKSK